MSGRLWRLLSEAYVTLKGIMRYKETAFWIIIFPLLWYGLMVAIWGNPQPPTVELAVYNGDGKHGNSTLADTLLKILNSPDFTKIENYTSPEDVREAVRQGKVPVGLIIPENFTENIEMGKTAELTLVYVREEWGNYSYNIVSGIINSFTEKIREKTINISIEFIKESPGPDNYTDYAVRWLEFIKRPIMIREDSIVPPLLATPGGIRAYYALSMIGVESLFIGLFTGVMILAERRRTGTLAILLSSPMRDWEILVADTLSALTAVAISATAVVMVSLATGAEYRVGPTHLATAAALMLAGTIFTIGIGLLLSTIAKTQEGATIVANAVAFPIMFAGGIVIPPQVLPDYMRTFAHIWPLSRSLEEARRLLLDLTTPWQAVVSSTPAILAAVIMYLVGMIMYRRMLVKIIEYY